MSRSFLNILCMVVAVFGAFAVWQNRSIAREVRAAQPLPLLPVHRLPIPATAQTATFAGGCFWGVEEMFRQVPGVVDTRAGYAGGTSPHPTYRTVHSDKTGHVEAVQVVFDPARVTYNQLLAVFFSNRAVSTTAPAKAKVGSAYRTLVFSLDAAQKAEAQAFVHRLGVKEAGASGEKGKVRRAIVGVVPAGVFWPAEEEHQRYYEKRGGESASGAACRL